MEAFIKGVTAGGVLLLEAIPILVWTMLISLALTWLLGQRPPAAKDKNGIPAVKWWKVHEFGRVYSAVTAIAAFGAFQGFVIGSVGFEEAHKTIAALITGAITFLSTVIALFYAKDAPDSFRAAIAPSVIAFLLCFLVFRTYPDRLSNTVIPDPTPLTEAKPKQ